MRAYAHVALWLLSHIGVNCAPIEPRALAAPGIGVEIEDRVFKMYSARGVGVDNKLIDDVKGSTLVYVDNPSAGLTCGPKWDLTAEHGGSEPKSGISDLTWEWIINGQQLKLEKTDDPADKLVLGPVWEDIIAKLKQLNPKKGDKFTIEAVDKDYGPWEIMFPSSFTEDLLNPGVQFTTALPMEAIQDLISIGATGKDTEGIEKLNFVFIPLARAKYSNMVKVTQEDLKDIYDSENDMTNELLGFYSLLMSYVKIGATMTDADRDNGPKQKLSIMPRTDWKTMYNLYAKEDDETRKKKPCRPKKKNPNQTLLEIVTELAKKKDIGDFDNAMFRWKDTDVKPPVPPKPEKWKSTCGNTVDARSGGVDENTKWDSKQKDFKDKTLSVKTWLEELDKGIDPLSVMDKIVWDGQIGGFGDKLEASLYPSDDETGYPLFELRDLVGSSVLGTTNLIKQAEIQIKTWHKSPPSGLKRRRRAVGAACKRPGNDNETCRGKQAPNAQGKCEDCPKGMKPNIANTECVKDDGKDQDAKEKKESKWEDTKKRMKDIFDKKKKDEEDRKKKEEEEAKKDRKKERMGKCLPLVSLSMALIEDGFPYATDYFSEDYIDSEDIMQNWPPELDDVPSADIDTDEYVNKFLEAMDDLTWVPWGGGVKKKRLVAPSAPKIAISTELAVVQRDTEVTHDKRFVKALFTALTRFFARAGSFLAKQANRLKSLKDRGGLRVSEKGKGAKYTDQKKTGDEIAKDKNWKNCIYGKAPEKNGPA